MNIEILYLIIPAIILFGLCRSTEKAVTIRNSAGIGYRLPADRFSYEIESVSNPK